VSDAAKNDKDGQVRSKAMFWLGRSRYPRALDFFLETEMTKSEFEAD